MDEAAIYEKLNDLFREVCDDETLMITASTSAKDIERWDSFNNVALMIAIEARFGIRLTSAEIEGFENVGDLASVIVRKSS
jgi:acyl carrier protein